MKNTITRGGKVLDIDENTVSVYREAEKAIKDARGMIKVIPPRHEKIDYEHAVMEVNLALYFALGYLGTQIEHEYYAEESVEYATINKMVTSLKNMTARVDEYLGLTDLKEESRNSEESETEEEVKEETVRTKTIKTLGYNAGRFMRLRKRVKVRGGKTTEKETNDATEFVEFPP